MGHRSEPSGKPALQWLSLINGFIGFIWTLQKSWPSLTSATEVLWLGKDDVPGDKVVDDDKVQGEQRVAADVDDFQAGEGENRQLVNLWHGSEN
jgi:hypothetical protein